MVKRWIERGRLHHWWVRLNAMGCDGDLVNRRLTVPTVSSPLRWWCFVRYWLRCRVGCLS